ncbi:MAG: hypothetical protein Q7R54_03680 [bacterium]|nr:hypothetical protein [bacterium]
MKCFALALALFALPVSVSAAGTPLFVGGSNVLVNTPATGNIYAVGGTVAVTTPAIGDLTLFGGSLVVDASVAGDALLVGGSLELTAPISGDARFVGGRIVIGEAVKGDLVAVGGSLTDLGGGAGNVFIIAGEIALTKGAFGPVTLYGNNISLAGTFAGDVHIVSAGRVTLDPATIIRGALMYQAPQEASIPPTAVIEGGVHYTGASYLPTSEEARAIALASFGVFLFVKILGALILAGLVAGLFSTFADRVVERALRGSSRRIFLTLLLGFGVAVATPILLTLLALTFVGLGLAFILGLVYLLLIPIAFIYTAIVLGAFMAHHLFKRTELRWSDAVFGMLILFLIWTLPTLGWLFVALATMYMLGVLTLLIYRFAFPRENLKEAEG